MADGGVKSALRERYRRERAERYVEHTFEYLLSAAEFIGADVIASYVSYGDEPNTAQLNQAIIAAGKTLLLPRINGVEMDWVRWNGDESSLKKYKKFLEPIGEPFTGSIDLIVVPALRIDRRGYRLGQGGGFYDRALVKDQVHNSWTIGLIHPDEISSEDLPIEEWDQPLNAAATPDLIIRFGV